jgi:putative ABC transport system substrate-binding protein
MTRREFIAVLGGAAAWPLAARAQQPKKVPQIGFLATGSLELPESLVMINAFRQGLRELSCVEGESVLVQYRTADSRIERFVDQASELVRLKVAIIVASNTPAARRRSKQPILFPLSYLLWATPSGTGSSPA